MDTIAAPSTNVSEPMSDKTADEEEVAKIVPNANDNSEPQQSSKPFKRLLLGRRRVPGGIS